MNLCASKRESARDGTCDGDFHRELGVAEDGEQGGDTGNDVGEHHGGSDLCPGLEAGEDEYAGADDGADAEPHEVPPVERLLHLVAAPSLHLHDFRVVLGSTQHSILQPPGRVHNRSRVVLPTLERLLREEVVSPECQSPPPHSGVNRALTSHPAECNVYL